MADPNLTIMLSSRNQTPLRTDQGGAEPVPLSDVRRDVKEAIEGSSVAGFAGGLSVWINEEAGAGNASADSWDTCTDQAEAADIVIVIYTGEAGWAHPDHEGDVGICHAEMAAALKADSSKVFGVDATDALHTDVDATERDKQFQGYWGEQSLFRASATTAEELTLAILETAGRAVVTRALQARSLPRSSDYGAAFDWSRLSYRDRKAALEANVRVGLTGQDGGEPMVSWTVEGAELAVIVHGIPDSLTVGAAREMVGQPFLYDHERIAEMPQNAIGPVHVIACHKNVTESQARRILGFPDALIVQTRFGIYVADENQRIQMVFLRRCSDPTATREAVRSLRTWLSQVAEGERLVQRARRRREILELVVKEDE